MDGPVRIPTVMLLIALAATGLAGCLGANGSLDAATAAQIADDHVRESHPDAIFVAIAAAEGPIDPELVQESMEAAADDDPVVQEMLDTFDLGVRNGDMADGLTGTWFTAHLTQSALIITQVLEAGEEARSVTIDMAMETVDAEPEPAMESAALLLPGLALAGERATMEQQPEDSVKVCARSPDTHILDSVTVTQIALDQGAFADALAADPDNDIIYGFGQEGDCDEAYWVITTVDIDNLLADEPEPFAGAMVSINAYDHDEVHVETFKVTAEDLAGKNGAAPFGPSAQYWRESGTEQATGEPIPSIVSGEPLVLEHAFEVPADGIYVSLNGDGYAQGLLGQSGSLELIGPEGTAYPTETTGYWFISEPAEGTWSLRYTAETTTPYETHEISYDIEVSWYE